MPIWRPLCPTLALVVALTVRAEIPADVTLVAAFSGFNFPVALRHAGDGSGRRFVVERAGAIRIVDSGGSTLPTVFLDLTSQVSTFGEGGLLGLAFHPDYPDNGRFYVHYTREEDEGLISRIAAFVVSGDPDLADAGSEQVVLEIPQDFSNHNGGDLHFGPDGYLWIGLGDGGSGNDPCNRAQTLDPNDLVTSCGASHPTTAGKALLGKMLRVDVDQATPAGANDLCGARADGSAAYAAPGDNPFVIALFRDRFALPRQSMGITAGACAEIWAYGLRNPYRFSFDRETGDLWIGDVGQNSWEEIDLERAGSSGGNNYGWKICEGSFERGSTMDACPLTDHHGPIHEYANDSTNCSVTGGFRYRGPIESLQGRYVFGDFCSGKVWFAAADGEGWIVEEFDEAGGNIVGFGEDEAGELYLLLSNGDILLLDGDRGAAADSIAH